MSPGDYWQWETHLERARLDMLRGRAEKSRALAEQLRTMPETWVADRIELAECLASIDIWTGRPEAAYEQVVTLVEEVAPTEASSDVGQVLTLAAHAAADCAASGARLDLLTGLRESCVQDPFAIRPVPADSKAWWATWNAELSRLRTRESVRSWASAAAEWDRLTRPHNAAYCRWRAAQFALTTGQAGVAAKLLRRATRDAREHVPLTAAIQRTAIGP